MTLATTLGLSLLLVLLASCAADSPQSPAVDAQPSVATGESAGPTESGGATASADASEAPGGEGQTVSIEGTSFGVAELTVAAGETVTFTNNSSLPHTVTEGTDGNAAEGARFNENLPAGESVEITFEEAGDVNVTCLFHANMNMVVHVE